MKALRLDLSSKALAQLCWAYTKNEAGCPADTIFKSECPFKTEACAMINKGRWLSVLKASDTAALCKEQTFKLKVTVQYAIPFTINAPTAREAKAYARRQAYKWVDQYCASDYHITAEVVEDEESAGSYTPYNAAECGTKKTETGENKQ